MKPSMSVDHEDIGSFRKSAHCVPDPGEFAIGEVRRDVREVDTSPDRCDFNALECVDRDRRGGGEHLIITIRHIDAADKIDRTALVPFDHRGRETLLILPEFLEEFELLQGSEDSSGVDPAMRNRHSFAGQSALRLLQEKPSVCADHAVRPARFRMVRQPCGDGPRRPSVT